MLNCSHPVKNVYLNIDACHRLKIVESSTQVDKKEVEFCHLGSPSVGYTSVVNIRQFQQAVYRAVVMRVNNW